MKVTLPVMVAGVKNANRRMYSKEAIQSALANNDRLYGELYRDDLDPRGINMEKVTHRIENTFFDGDVLYADVNILPTPRGITVRALLPDLVATPRGLGVIKEGVVSEYVIHAIDLIPRNQWSFNHVFKEHEDVPHNRLSGPFPQS